MYVCRAQDNILLSHCAEQGLRQCEYCEWYQDGHGEAHYPVPAMPLAVCIAHDVVLIAEAEWYGDELEFHEVYSFPS